MSKDREVLADTGAWLAAFHSGDQYHQEAVGELRRLRGRGTRLIVTDLILAELHIHLLYGLGPVGAADHMATLKSDPLIEEVFTDAVLQESAMTRWIRQFADQSFSLTDSVSFAVMRARGIGAAFTFDRHFSIAGFRMLPESRRTV